MSETTYYNLTEFSDAFKEWDEARVCTWVHNLLFEGRTFPPFHWYNRDDNPIFLLVEEIRKYTLDNPQAKRNLETAIARCYTDFSGDTSLSQQDVSRIGTELFPSIRMVMPNELFDRLKQDALDGKYKSVPLTNSPKEVWDLHSFLLNALFGLEPKDKGGLVQIIDRDIHDTRYSYECFDAVYKVVGDVLSGLKYVPLIVSQIGKTGRYIHEAIKEYVEALEKADLSHLRQQSPEELTQAELGAYSEMLTKLNQHIEGYTLQITRDGLTINNTNTTQRTVIPLTNQTTPLIRASLKYIGDNVASK